MKVLVPIKRVPDPYAKIRVLPDGSGIETSGLKYVVNPFDEIAVEEAVRLKERLQYEIVVVSIGGDECEEQLRSALAMGADRGILVLTDEPTDSRVIAHILAAVYKRENPNVVFMGKQAIDDDSNQAGQMLAGLLGIPQGTFASKIEVCDTGQGMLCTREVDAGQETIFPPLPCVITADLRLNEPRYVALPGIIKARSKPLDKITIAELGVTVKARVKTVKLTAPPARKAGRKVGSVDELITALKTEAKVI